MSSQGDNLFSNLSKYKPSQNRTPLENFLTEAFAFVLNRVMDGEFRSHIIRCIAGDRLPQLPATLSDIVISTQVRVPYHDKKKKRDVPCIIDMVCESETVLLYVENKVDSEVAKSQLKRYKQALQENKGSRHGHIVFIGNNEPRTRLKKDEFINERWFNIYRYVDEFCREHDIEGQETVDSFIINQFKDFMEEKGMAIHEIRENVSSILKERWNLIQIVSSVKQRLENKENMIVGDRDINIQYYRGFYFYNEDKTREYQFGLYDREGKIGFNTKLEPNEAKDLAGRLGDEWEIRFARYVTCFLDVDGIDNFYATDLEGQIDSLRRFVEDRFNEVERCFG